MRSLALALLCIVGCAGSPVLPPTSHCEFQPGDMVQSIEGGKPGRVVAVHNWDSKGCVVDVHLGNWIIEDMNPDRLIHAY